MLKHRSILAAGLLALAAGAQGQDTDPVRADKNMIRAHLTFLADDLLEGRETGSRGYDIAAHYVTTQFLQYGLAPKGDQGSFLQQVPLRATRLVQESPLLELSSKAGTEKLAYLDEYMTSGSLLEDRSAAAAPLVFVGYGIEADRLQHHDYAGVDVKGKIVVVLSGKPRSFPTEEGAHFASGEQKREVAARHGAVGMITIPTPGSEKAVPFAKLKEYRYIPSMSWVDKNGVAAHQQPTLQNRYTLSMPAARKLFAQSGMKLDSIYEQVAADKPVPRGDLGVSARMASQSTRSDLKSSNVVGMIEGSDPGLKNEYVVFSAHLDHLGQVKEKSGDNIFNGAMDNASGVATLIETARLFSQGKVKPRRSILFVAVTGEEKGLLGADYFATNPTVPAGAIVANVNLDMPLLTFDFKNVMAFGAEHSSLKGNLTRALKPMNLELISDPWPEQGLFTRSDHYMFVRQGIPSIFLATGMASFQKGEDGAKQWEHFLSTNYHQPTDDLKLPFNFDAAARFAQLNYNIALEIANAADKPTWNKGDFFGDTFRK
ncbi:M28 family metallopeptidase [Massilia sp. Root418]|uniref:M28 family metallopeptidase n=1 Tax=Massilia sp. Root418 TaxID=1736532 RepID=UPI000AB8C3DC|nr:M28 family metallopeptidase [Massilia sp. Root418]